MARAQKDNVTSGNDVVFEIAEKDPAIDQPVIGADTTASVGSDAATTDPMVLDALSEIKVEAAQAKHAMAFAKSANPESVLIPVIQNDGAEETEEQQRLRREADQDTVQRLRERAFRQRERGLKQLTTAPTRRGDMELVRKVEVYDVPIANMVQRFVSIADRLISRLHGFGALIMGEEKAGTSIQILTGYIDELHRDAKTLHDHTLLALKTQREKCEATGLDWMDPKYARAALGVEVHLMRREGNKMLEAFLLYDKSIEMLRVLEWNDGTDPDQIDDIVNRARKMGGKIFRSALAGQIELGRLLQRRGENGQGQRSEPAEQSEHADHRPETAVAA